jgi:hypothetical protein
MAERTAFDDIKDAANSLIGRVYKEFDDEFNQCYVFEGIGVGYNPKEHKPEDYFRFYDLSLDQPAVRVLNELKGMKPVLNYRDLDREDAEVLAYWELEQAENKQRVNDDFLLISTASTDETTKKHRR